MRSSLKVFLEILVLWVVTVALYAGVMQANAAPSSFSHGAYGAVTLVAATATAIPTTSLSSRSAVAVQNLHATVPIYCGWDSSVTSLTGWEVTFGGGSASFAMGSSPTSTATLYCISASTQTTTTNVRYQEM